MKMRCHLNGRGLVWEGRMDQMVFKSHSTLRVSSIESTFFFFLEGG